MLRTSNNPQTVPPSDETIYRAVSQAGISLGMNVARSAVFAGDDAESDDAVERLPVAARRVGIHCREMEFNQLFDALSFLREGFPILVVHHDGAITFVDAGRGKRFDTLHIHDSGLTSNSASRRKLRALLVDQPASRVFVAKQELECDVMASDHGHQARRHHDHQPPLRRFLNLLAMDQRDISIVVIFAFVAGILTLATPLAVESLVNVVSWGVYLQPLLILGLVLMVCLGFAGVLQILQKFAVEMIQRRQFVRIVGDLAHRFPRANQASLAKEFPRELANRIFDIMTIQKATAVLLLDGVSIVLTTLLGMVLLAFYHPFLLGFDIVLLISMISITWVLGRGGINTAIDESITKYETVHWLQDVLASPVAFKIGGGEALAIDRANELTSSYLQARKRQFRVVIRQASFAIMLQVFASTAVLALGGWLVIDGQLTLGQLVASELVVTVIVGAFAKAGKSLEKFYDLMAGVDKVGHLIDIPVDPRPETIHVLDEPMALEWNELSFKRPVSTSKIPALSIQPGATVALVGDDIDGKSDFAKALAGLVHPSEGVIRAADMDPAVISGGDCNQVIGYAGANEIFTGTIRENVDLGRPKTGQSRVRTVLESVGLSEVLLRLQSGLQTKLQTGGFPLTDEQVARLMLARAIISNPSVLVINGTLDRVAPSTLDEIWEILANPEAPWTLVVATEKSEIAARCSQHISIRRSNHTVMKGASQ